LFLIYKLTFTNGKSYIGQTIRKWRIRFSQHKRAALTEGSQLAVHCAWRKYGKPSVEFLGEYESLNELHDAERAAISAHNTISQNGYNISYGGDTAPSSNPEVAAKIAAKAKGRLHTEETKAVMADGVKERWLDPEYREKVLSGISEYWTDERKEKRGEQFKEIWAKKYAEGYKVSEQTKEKMRNKVFSEETRRKMSEASKGKKKAPRSPETRAKLAESLKRQWSDPEAARRRGEAISAALKAKYANLSPEEHAKFMEQRKKNAETRKRNRLKQ
jgi:hypothetical protein